MATTHLAEGDGLQLHLRCSAYCAVLDGAFWGFLTQCPNAPPSKKTAVVVFVASAASTVGDKVLAAALGSSGGGLPVVVVAPRSFFSSSSCVACSLLGGRSLLPADNAPYQPSRVST